MYHRLTKEELKERDELIFKRLSEGFPPAVVARRMGVKDSVVHTTVRRYGKCWKERGEYQKADSGSYSV